MTSTSPSAMGWVWDSPSQQWVWGPVPAPPMMPRSAALVPSPRPLSVASPVRLGASLRGRHWAVRLTLGPCLFCLLLGLWTFQYGVLLLVGLCLLVLLLGCGWPVLIGALIGNSRARQRHERRTATAYSIWRPWVVW